MRPDRYDCYLCGSSANAIRRHDDFGVYIYECTGCGLLQTERLPKAFIDDYYKSLYSEHRSTHVTDAYVDFSRKRGVNQRQFLEKGSGETAFARVLDYGAGIGGALAAFPECEKYAWDPDPNAAAKIDPELDIKLVPPDELHGGGYRQFFDVVILSHVVEHLLDPLDELVKLSQLVRDGGYIFVEVPRESEVVLEYMANARKLETGHVFHFSEATLRRLLEAVFPDNIVALETCGVSARSFYAGQTKLLFDQDDAANGVWLRAVVRVSHNSVLAPPRRKHHGSARNRLLALRETRRAELEAVRHGAAAYELLAKHLPEAIPAASTVLTTEGSDFQKLFFVAERLVQKNQSLVAELSKAHHTISQLKEGANDVANDKQSPQNRLETKAANGELAGAAVVFGEILRGELKALQQPLGDHAALLRMLEARMNAELDTAKEAERHAELKAELTRLEGRCAVLEEAQLVSRELTERLDATCERVGALTRHQDTLQDEVIATMSTQVEALSNTLEGLSQRFAMFEKASAAAQSTLHEAIEAERQRGDAAEVALHEQSAQRAKLEQQHEALRQEASRERDVLQSQLDVARGLSEKAAAVNGAAAFSESGAHAHDADERIAALEAQLRNAVAERDAAQSAIAAIRGSESFQIGAAITSPYRGLKSAFSSNHSEPIAVNASPVVHGKGGGVTKTRTGVTSRISARPLQRTSNVLPLTRNDRTNPSCQAFYEHNGFAVFRNVLPLEEVAHTSQQFRADLILDPAETEHTTFDIANVYPPGQEYVFDDRILTCMRTCLGDEIRFLQWSTYQLNHISFPWHRDGGNRQFGVGLDWDESRDPYRVAKIIVYLECDNFALAVFPGSHKVDIDRTHIVRDRSGFNEVYPNDVKVSDDLYGKPCLAHMRPGDAVVFDQRLLHCGRLLSDTNQDFTKQIKSDKSFLSYTYGADSPHSNRFFYYFNYERKFDVAPMHAALRDNLERQGLLLSTIDENYYDNHPEERETLWLPK